jgi:hypothetical protein
VTGLLKTNAKLVPDSSIVAELRANGAGVGLGVAANL